MRLNAPAVRFSRRGSRDDTAFLLSRFFTAVSRIAGFLSFFLFSRKKRIETNFCDLLVRKNKERLIFRRDVSNEIL